MKLLEKHVQNVTTFSEKIIKYIELKSETAENDALDKKILLQELKKHNQILSQQLEEQKRHNKVMEDLLKD